MAEQLSSFKQNLEMFARKHKKEINRDPEFRRHFQQMCASIGVDPLASNKGFWAEILGVGDFYYEVAVQAIEVCMLSRNSMQGGLMLLMDLVRQIQDMRGPSSQPISEDDVEVAIKKMKVLGQGFDIVQIGSKKLVRSVPVELNVDHVEVINMAQSNDGFVSVVMLQEKLGWTFGRTISVLKLMMQEGIIWLDSQAEPKSYWLPGLSNFFTQ